MRKLRLEDIRVDSYETGAVLSVEGTVQANMITTLCETNQPRCQSATNCTSCVSSPWCC